LKRLVRCPNCGFTFDLSYSRAFSCRGCPMSVFGDCEYVKCPRCGYEFPLERGVQDVRNVLRGLSEG